MGFGETSTARQKRVDSIEHTIEEVAPELREACNKVFLVTKDALDQALAAS